VRRSHLGEVLDCRLWRTGKIVTSVDRVGHTDDLWYDGAGKRIYMSGGDSEIGISAGV
jgi:hypothetical protein